MLMRSISKATVIRFAVMGLVLAACIGATVQAWRYGSSSATEGRAESDMSLFIRGLHQHGHTKNLPVQVIEDYN
jgi:hypothetical protein